MGCFFKTKKAINWDEVNKQIKPFTLNGLLVEGKIVEVYDGDTCKVVFPYFEQLYKWTLRLERIDTPELKTKNDLERSFGFEVRDILRNMILDKIVKVKCGKFDKYGRLLAEIYINGQNVNQYLLDNNYAFAYDGGTKNLWEPYLVYIGYKPNSNSHDNNSNISQYNTQVNSQRTSSINLNLVDNKKGKKKLNVNNGITMEKAKPQKVKLIGQKTKRNKKDSFIDDDLNSIDNINEINSISKINTFVKTKKSSKENIINGESKMKGKRSKGKISYYESEDSIINEETISEGNYSVYSD